MRFEHPLARLAPLHHQTPALARPQPGRAEIGRLQPGRELVPFKAPPVPAVAAAPDQDIAEREKGPSPFAGLIDDIDVRHMSPRQGADMSLDLYIAGILSWDEYSLLAFQPELHPDYDSTIGALIGEKAGPDRRRDFVAEWERRLVFEKKYNAGETRLIERTERIVEVLKLAE